MADVSRKEVEELKSQAASAFRRLANMKEEMKESLGYVRQTMEVGLTSFAVAYALARWGTNGNVSVMGVPVELGGALVLKALAFTGLLDSYSGDAHNIGDGMLSVYLVKKAFQMGAPQGNLSVSGASHYGALPQGGYSAPYSDAQMAAAMAA